MMMMMMMMMTWVANARRSSSNDSAEQTLQPLFEVTSTTLFVANSHFFDTSDSSGNNGCLHSSVSLNYNKRL